MLTSDLNERTYGMVFGVGMLSLLRTVICLVVKNIVGLRLFQICYPS